MGTLPAGHRLFAQYAHAPNALGYCGPGASAALRSVACGLGDGVDVPELASRFSGAWPYQRVLARMCGVDDPLDESVVRGYWTGNELTAAVDRAEFGAALLEEIKPQAGHYWSHLDDAVRREAAPTHSFHVFSVYPWSRLLATCQPEPLNVLDSCRIGWARVLDVGLDRLRVLSRHLEYDGTRLRLGPPQEDHIDYRREGACFVDAISAGDTVAVHWGFACDRLTAEQETALESWTTWQLRVMEPRLRADRPEGAGRCEPASGR